MLAHVSFIDNVINEKTNVSHSFFHYITYGFHKLLNIDIIASSVAINTIFVLILSITIHLIIIFSVEKKTSKYLILLLVFTVMYSGTLPLHKIGLTKYQYLGNGSISVWHNVTLFMVKPFAFASFFLFFYAANINLVYEKIILITSYVLAIVSIWAKPSFIVVFMPAILIYSCYFYIIGKKSKLFFIYASIMTLSSIFLLAWQASITYSSGDQGSGVIFAPFQVWNLYSNNILLSIVVANIFSVSFICSSYKNVSERSKLSFLMFLGGVAMFVIFAESGERFRHANFAWSYVLTMQLLYLSTIVDFTNRFYEINYKVRNFLLICIVSVHT